MVSQTMAFRLVIGMRSGSLIFALKRMFSYTVRISCTRLSCGTYPTPMSIARARAWVRMRPRVTQFFRIRGDLKTSMVRLCETIWYLSEPVGNARLASLPTTAFSRVVFPAPLDPRIAFRDPTGKVRLTRSRIFFGGSRRRAECRRNMLRFSTTTLICVTFVEKLLYLEIEAIWSDVAPSLVPRVFIRVHLRPSLRERSSLRACMRRSHQE